MRLIDLSIPIAHGDGRLGVEVSFERPYTFENCGWQGSSFKMFAHYGSHVDAPRHFLPDGLTIDQVPLKSLIGPAAVIDLTDHCETMEISGDTLEERGRHVEQDDIVILRTTWTDKCWGTDKFWEEGPYLSAEGANWLVEHRIKSVVYDFSEEYVVRKSGFRGEDCEIHHKILGSDIFNIEYVRGLNQINRPRCAIMAMPLNLSGLDGAPARVIAIEGHALPKEFEVVAV